MTRAVVVGASLVTLALAGSIASADTPAWCKVDGRIEQGFIDAVKKDDDAVRAVIAIAYMSCNPQYVQQEDRAALADGYKKWSKRLALTDADWADMAQFATGRGDLELRPSDEKAKWSTMGGGDQYAYLQRPAVFTPGLSGETDFFYAADAFGSRLTEVGRMGVIQRCFASGRGHGSVEMAICQPDIDAFDFDKVVAEIRSDKDNTPVVRAILRLVADKTRSEIPARKDEIAKLVKKDDAYKKMFEIAAQARKDWDARAKANADILAVQDLMDDAMVSNSRKATEGCQDKTWKALTAAIAKLPAKSFAVKRIPDKEYEFPEDVMNRVVEIVIADPAGYLAASAYTQCQQLAAEKPDNLSKMLTSSLHYWSGYRGPRTSGYTAILLANLELDDRSERIDYPDIERIWFHQGNAQGGGSSGGIDSVKTKGDVATITFSQKLVKETVDTGCTRSNHVVGIRDNGSIEYEYNCTGSKVITYDARPQPADVNARYATGLKGGGAVMVNTDIVWMGWAKPEASIPSSVLGVAVK